MLDVGIQALIRDSVSSRSPEHKGIRPYYSLARRILYSIVILKCFSTFLNTERVDSDAENTNFKRHSFLHTPQKFFITKRNKRTPLFFLASRVKEEKEVHFHFYVSYQMKRKCIQYIQRIISTFLFSKKFSSRTGN